MTGRRGGAVAVLAALAWWLLAGGPAQAAAPSGGITSPAADAVLTTKTPTISGSYTQPGGGRVDEVAVIVQSAEGHGTWSKVFPTNGSSTLDFAFQLPALAYNGRYRAQSQAKGTDAIETNGQEASPISVRDFGVAVPPAVPTGLRAAASSSKQQVSLTWNANAEPDMLGYEVQRQASGGSGWTAVAQSVSTSAVDPVPSPGTWKYRVVAIRSGASSSEGVTSDPSPSTSATVDPPPTTTTTTAKPAAGSGSGSGSGAGTDGPASGGSGSGSAGSGSPSSQGGSSDQALARAGRVDLSGYAALLDANRRRLQTTPTTEFDPGYQETLPFQPVEDGLGEGAVEGGQSVELGFAQTRVTDEGAQRRKMAYFAGSMLAFVLAMHGWFLRSELRRHDELEALDAGADDGAGAGADTDEGTDSGTEPHPAGGDAADDGTGPGGPGPATATVAPDRAEEGGRRARRAARRVPPRPGDDRPEGGPAVRPRRRGAVGRDRRPAV